MEHLHVRGHRLGAPKERVGFQQDQQKSRPVHLLDPANAYQAGEQASWWRPTRPQAGRGCLRAPDRWGRVQRGAGGRVRLGSTPWTRV